MLLFFLISSQTGTKIPQKTESGIVTSSPAISTATPKPEEVTQITLADVLDTKGIFMPQEQVAAIINGKNIYNKELNYYLFTQRRSEYFEHGNLADLKKSILEDVINNKILLSNNTTNNSENSASDITIVNLDEEAQQLKTAKNEINQQSTEKISGGMLSIWYHNIKKPPDYTIAEAKTIARSKLEAIRTQLTDPTNPITFAQAGELLKNDSSLAGIDPSYKINSYVPFIDKSPSDMIFVYQDINDQINNLKTGEISRIIDHASDPNGKNTDSDEEFLAILTVDKRINTGEGDLKEWITKQKTNFDIVIPTL